MATRTSRVALSAVALGLALAGAAAAPAASAATGPGTGLEVTVTVPRTADSPFTVANAELRWGLNTETGSPSFFGGCNFISAGAAGNTGGSKVWTATDGHFRTTAGNVTVQKPYASGRSTAYRPMPFGDRCKDPSGRALSTASTASSGVQAVVGRGTGAVDPRTGTTTIRWSGSFTVAMYGGLAYWWVSDPVLTLAGGRGQVTGTAQGYGSSRDDVTTWTPVPARTVVLATLSGVDLRSARGFATAPAYRGVGVTVPAGTPAQARSGSEWGAFPQSFVDFQQATGQASYWYSSGGARDRFKVASTLYVSYDATAPVPVTPTPVPPAPAPGPSDPSVSPGGGSPAGPPGQAPVVPGSAPPAVAAPASFPAVLARTIGARKGGLVPVIAAAAGGSALPWSVAALLGATAVTVVGYRRGWLVRPRSSQLT